MPAVISRTNHEEVTLYGSEPDEERKKLAWRAVLRSWYRTHPEELRREDPEQIEPGAYNSGRPVSARTIHERKTRCEPM